MTTATKILASYDGPFVCRMNEDGSIDSVIAWIRPFKAGAGRHHRRWWRFWR